MQEYMRRYQSLRSDVCTTDHPDIRRMEVDMNYFDEKSWEPLDAKLVVAAEKEKVSRLKKMQVHTYVNRQETEMDDEGKFVKMKWIRVNKGCKINQKDPILIDDSRSDFWRANRRAICRNVCSVQGHVVDPRYRPPHLACLAFIQQLVNSSSSPSHHGSEDCRHHCTVPFSTPSSICSCASCLPRS